MNKASASTIDTDVEVSTTPSTPIAGLAKVAGYLETRYTLWKRRCLPGYTVDEAEIEVLEKAATYCLENDFDAATYFQAQVDEIEGVEAITTFKTKDFYNPRAVKRAVQYRTARNVRDKALLAIS